MRIRDCTREDLDAVNRLRTEWYGPATAVTRAFFDWAFFDRCPEPAVFLGLEDDGRLVGTQAFFPTACRQGDTVISACKSEETILAPPYRGRGFLERLYGEGFARLDPRVDVTWGETSAIRPLERSGFVHPATMRIAVVFTGPPTRRFPLGREERRTSAKRRLRRAAFSALQAVLQYRTRLRVRAHRTDTRVREDADLAFYESAGRAMARQFPEMISVDRSADWLDWRLVRHPLHRFRFLRFEDANTRAMLAYCVDPGRRVAHLVDFVAAGDIARAADALLPELVARVAREGGSLLADHGLALDNPLQRERERVFSRFGWLKVPLPREYLVLRLAPRLSPQDPRFAAGRWYYTGLMSHG